MLYEPLWFQLWLEQRPERRAKEKEKRKQKMQQMALIKGFTESRSASRKRLKHEQGTGVFLCWAGERADAKTTKLILLDSLLQEVEATLPHLVLQKKKE